MALEETAWEVARLNRLRGNDSLQPGMLLKIVVSDGQPVVLPRRQLDISGDRPLPPPPPLALPNRRPQGPYRGDDDHHENLSIAANLLPHLLQLRDAKIRGAAGIDEGALPGFHLGHSLGNLCGDRHRDAGHSMLVTMDDVLGFTTMPPTFTGLPKSTRCMNACETRIQEAK